FYTDEAMDLIVACDEPDLHFFRRPTASALTGHPWDEPQCLSFLPEHHDLLHDTALRLVNTGDGKRIPLWRLLGALHGVWQADHHRDVAKLPGQTHIDDWTDDFDTPRQAVSWLGRYYRNRVDVTVIMSWSNRT